MLPAAFLLAASLAAVGDPAEAGRLPGFTPSAFTAGGATPRGPAPNNVIVIVIDDVGVDLVGAYESYFRGLGRPPGFPAETPAIDAMLCAKGVSFANAWTAPMCSPTRAQILTGMYGARTGVGSILRRIPLGGIANPGLAAPHVILPEALAASPSAYNSAAIGKWHLADVGQLATDLAHPLGAPHGRWFDAFAGSLFNLEKAPSAPQGTNPYYAWRKAYATAIQVGVDPCGPLGVPCEVDVVAPPITNYATADTTEDALTMIGQLQEPWFLYLAYNAPHTPPHIPPLTLPKPTCPDYPPLHTPCEFDRAGGYPAQARCALRTLDEQIGRLLCAYDSSDTTVILIGDNGTDSDATLPPFDATHAKGQCYQGGVHVPMVVRSPLIPPALQGTFNAELVSAVDIFATVAEIGGASATTPDSVSLLPYLTGAATGPLRAVVYQEAFFPNFTPTSAGAGPAGGYVGGHHNQAVRDARFKLIRRADRMGSSATIDYEEEFYDLLQGGPLDPTTQSPTPDWFEANDLLAAGTPLRGAALLSYQQLAAWLDANFPPVVY